MSLGVSAKRGQWSELAFCKKSGADTVLCGGNVKRSAPTLGDQDQRHELSQLGDLWFCLGALGTVAS